MTRTIKIVGDGRQRCPDRDGTRECTHDAPGSHFEIYRREQIKRARRGLVGLLTHGGGFRDSGHFCFNVVLLGHCAVIAVDSWTVRCGDIRWLNSVRTKLITDEVLAGTPRHHTEYGNFEPLAAVGTARCLTGHSAPRKTELGYSRPRPTITFVVPHQQDQRIGNPHQKLASSDITLSAIVRAAGDALVPQLGACTLCQAPARGRAARA